MGIELRNNFILLENKKRYNKKQILIICFGVLLLIYFARLIKDYFNLPLYHPAHSLIVEFLMFFLIIVITFGHKVLKSKKLILFLILIFCGNLFYYKIPVLVIIMICGILLFGYYTNFERLGLNKSNILKEIILGIILAIPFSLISVNMGLSAEAYIFVLDPNQSFFLKISVILICIKTALIQELTLRGGIQAMFDAAFGRYYAVFATVIFWILAHIIYQKIFFTPFIFIITAIVGVILAIFYAIFRNINTSLGFHMILTSTLGMIFGLPTE